MDKTKLKSEIKKELTDYVERELEKIIKSKQNKDLIKEISTKILISFFKTMYQKSVLWKDDV